MVVEHIVRNLLNLIWCVNKTVGYNSQTDKADVSENDIVDSFELIQLWIEWLT